MNTLVDLLKVFIIFNILKKKNIIIQIQNQKHYIAIIFLMVKFGWDMIMVTKKEKIRYGLCSTEVMNGFLTMTL